MFWIHGIRMLQESEKEPVTKPIELTPATETPTADEEAPHGDRSLESRAE